MKKPFKLAKMTILKFAVVTVVSVTFFIAGTLVFAAWQGPTQQPPDGNPAGFIFNSSVPQTAQFNVTGSGAVGSLTVSGNAAVGGDAVVIGSICFDNQDDANCIDGWGGIGGGFWAENAA